MNHFTEHQTISLFASKGAIYYVTIETVIFIFTCEDIMFSRESSPGILLVFI